MSFAMNGRAGLVASAEAEVLSVPAALVVEESCPVVDVVDGAAV